MLLLLGYSHLGSLLKASRVGLTQILLYKGLQLSCGLALFLQLLLNLLLRSSLNLILAKLLDFLKYGCLILQCLVPNNDWKACLICGLAASKAAVVYSRAQRFNSFKTKFARSSRPLIVLVAGKTAAVVDTGFADTCFLHLLLCTN